MARLLILICAALLASPAWGYDARLVLPEMERPAEVSPMTWNQSQAASVGAPIRPAVAGLLSALVPGWGQLKLGQQRGWIYLGLDVVSWFGYFALDAAGDQGVRDYQEYADQHWDWDRYRAVASCGDGLGPIDFDQENAALMDIFETDRDLFYAEIGDQEEYACGWDEQGSRGRYNRDRDHASELSNRATNLVYVLMLNRLVSAIDAARSASTAQTSLDLQWRLDSFGDPQVRLSISRGLR